MNGGKRQISGDTFDMLLEAVVQSAGAQDPDRAALVFDSLSNRFAFIEKISEIAVI